MKKPIMLFLLLGLTGFINAQSALMNPLAIQSQGEMPPAMQKALQDEKESGLKYLLYHGKIVYGSTVNQYLDKILDNLLINEPQLRKEITLLVVKSPVVNAYANAQGILLINIGLIAQTSNEAELAFVLAHEIIHYALKHHYIERASDDNMNNFLQRHFASRDQESEADTKGIARFYSLSNYSYAAIDGAFDVLQYGHLPFDNIRFDRSFVENSYYQFPDKYFLQNVKPISNRDDYVDTLCTHPN
ncbi:MAG: M48 family metallopeptidase, partial [Bacteroidales bacterium]|nr:M48 family metallopeptidase [Bacteroidales bacterium]